MASQVKIPDLARDLRKELRRSRYAKFADFIPCMHKNSAVTVGVDLNLEAATLRLLLI